MRTFLSQERQNELSISAHRPSARSNPTRGGPKPSSKAIRSCCSFAERPTQQGSRRQLPDASMLASCQGSEAKPRSSSRKMIARKMIEFRLVGRPSVPSLPTRRNSRTESAASFKLTSDVSLMAGQDDSVLGSLTRQPPAPAKLLKGKDVVTANQANDFGLRLILGLAVFLFVASMSTLGCWTTGASSDIVSFITLLAMPSSVCIVALMHATMSDEDSELM